jgi:hypothetical protein
MMTDGLIDREIERLVQLHTHTHTHSKKKQCRTQIDQGRSRLQSRDVFLIECVYTVSIASYVAPQANLHSLSVKLYYICLIPNLFLLLRCESESSLEKKRRDSWRKTNKCRGAWPHVFLCIGCFRSIIILQGNRTIVTI